MLSGSLAKLAPIDRSGTQTIAGQPCTTLAFDSKRYGKPELCVTATGIVARFHLEDTGSGTVTTFEAQTITPGNQPDDTFKVPDDLTVEGMKPM